MSEIKREDAYFVEVDQNGCDRCGCSRTYCVVGPDGVAGSTSYEDEEDADAMADALNEAFHQGRSDFDRLQQERDTLARRVQEWQPIETPPDWKGPHSLKLYGWGPVCGYVFCNYTPHYLGHPDEAKSLWTADNWGWVAKPTHWMPLPAPPVRD